jgi:hypothetical protein
MSDNLSVIFAAGRGRAGIFIADRRQSVATRCAPSRYVFSNAAMETAFRVMLRIWKARTPTPAPSIAIEPATAGMRRARRGASADDRADQPIERQ